MTTYRVDCINKPNRFDPNSRIQRLGGTSPRVWNDTETAVIAAINAGDSFYVQRDGFRANVIIAYRGLTPYLKTDADSVLVDNLLSLPECR